MRYPLATVGWCLLAIWNLGLDPDVVSVDGRSRFLSSCNCVQKGSCVMTGDR